MVERNSKSRGLGRGLSALMSDVSTNSKENIESSQNPSNEKLVPVEKIYPNPNQPRKLFQEEKLIELAKSIKTKGLRQTTYTLDELFGKVDVENILDEIFSSFCLGK